MSESTWNYPIILLLAFLIIGLILIVIANDGDSISFGKIIETCVTIKATNETTCTIVKEGFAP